jgi:hypothetical protein
MRRKFSLAALVFLLVASGVSQAQTVQTLVNQPPDGLGISFLLTDGRLLTQGNAFSDWAILTPDKFGSYVNGTWKTAASLPSGYVPDAFASAVLADGRVIIEGGEYNPPGQFAFTNLGAIYDPVKDTWTKQRPPTRWAFIGDSPSAVLPNGHFLLGSKFDRRIAELDPTTLTWSDYNLTGKFDRNAEEGWTLLPDGSVLTYDVTKAPHSERYLPGKHKWVSAGSTIVDLHSPSPFGCIPYGTNGKYCYYPPGEVGPGILRPDGTVFATGSASNGGIGVGHTAIYHPSTNKWTVGPDFPNGDNAGDSFAVLLPNGNVLVLGGQGLYDFDGANLTPDPVGFAYPILVLPTGQVLAQGNNVEVYNPTGTYQAAWAPVITAFPKSVRRGSTYKISGQQFNGLSQAAAFGDEDETATNYPLVRITNNASHHVFYAKTHDHSTMGVATGKAPVFTNFDVPARAETGAGKLEVVANGIPSKPVKVMVK